MELCKLPRRPSEQSGLVLGPLAADLYDREFLRTYWKFKEWCERMVAAKQDPQAHLDGGE